MLVQLPLISYEYKYTAPTHCLSLNNTIISLCTAAEDRYLHEYWKTERHPRYQIKISCGHTDISLFAVLDHSMHGVVIEPLCIMTETQAVSGWPGNMSPCPFIASTYRSGTAFQQACFILIVLYYDTINTVVYVLVRNTQRAP